MRCDRVLESERRRRLARLGAACTRPDSTAEAAVRVQLEELDARGSDCAPSWTTPSAPPTRGFEKRGCVETGWCFRHPHRSRRSSRAVSRPTRAPAQPAPSRRGAGTNGVSANLSLDGEARPAPARARVRVAAAPALAGTTRRSESRRRREARTCTRRSRATHAGVAPQRADRQPDDTDPRARASRRCLRAAVVASVRPRAPPAAAEEAQRALPAADDPLPLPPARVQALGACGSICGSSTSTSRASRRR